jgi:hypothetical protein
VAQWLGAKGGKQPRTAPWPPSCFPSLYRRRRPTQRLGDRLSLCSRFLVSLDPTKKKCLTRQAPSSPARQGTYNYASRTYQREVLVFGLCADSEFVSLSLAPSTNLPVHPPSRTRPKGSMQTPDSTTITATLQLTNKDLISQTLEFINSHFVACV